MEECEHELVFYQSGRVKGLAERAKEAIRILNLDCDELRSRRKKAIRDFLYGTECWPPEEDVDGWDDEILNELINQCRRAGADLAPYAPVLINICSTIINGREKSEKESDD